MVGSDQSDELTLSGYHGIRPMQSCNTSLVLLAWRWLISRGTVSSCNFPSHSFKRGSSRAGFLVVRNSI